MVQKIIDFRLDNKNNIVYLQFQNNERATIYKFADGVYTVTSDGITKKVLKEVKNDCLLLFYGRLSEDGFKNKWVFKN
jgi:hypothetical protein